MANPSNSAVQNLLPVQAYFDAQNNFITFIGQGQPFYASIDPSQTGLNITNSVINSTTIGLTVPAAAAFTNVAMNTGTIATQPTGANDIVNLLALQSYAAGISWKQPCAVATLTNITLSGLQTIDTYTTLAGDRVLVKDQGTAANNGIYIASSGPWSRAEDANSWNELIAAISFIEYGTQKGGAWFCTAQPGGTLGVTAVNWSQFTTSATYTAGTGLTLTGFEFSITNTGVPANTYGSATATPVFAVNAQGQITSVTNTTITPAIGNVTGLGTGVATFLATPTSANLAAMVSDETGTGALVFAQSPTLITPALGTPASGVMTNVTGLPLTTGVTGTLPIGNGGTGQTTASAAFNALSPITTAGDLIYGSGVNTASRLGIGTTGQVLTVVGGVPAWSTVAANVSSFSAGTTGLTPSTATTGAITLAGTLVAANGGTGQSSYTIGDILYASTTTALSKLAGVATGNALISGGVGAAPSWGKIDLTTTVSGILPGANGGTGNGFFAVSGPATSLKTFTFPNASATVLTTNDLVTVAQGGTGVGTLSGLAYGNGTSAFTAATGAQVVSVIGSTAVTNATNAVNIGITDDTTTNATVYPTWVTTTTGNLPVKTASTKLSFNPSTGIFSATGFAGSTLNGSSTLSLQTGGTTGLYINSSQYIGIGTTNPINQFVVSNAGAGGFEISTASNNISVNSYNRNSSAWIDLAYNANQHIFNYAGTSEAMRITSSGNIGIGTATPGSNKLHVRGTTSEVLVRAISVSPTGNGVYGQYNAKYDGTDRDWYFGQSSTGSYGFWFNTGAVTYAGGFDNSGRFTVNTTSALNSALITTKSTTNVPGVSIWNAAGTSGFYSIMDIFNAAGNSRIGGITKVNDNAVTFDTTSDYRLKDDIKPMSGALDKVIQLKPVTYKWKTDGTSGQGFIAHELEEIIPDAVIGKKDAVNEDGSIKAQSIDTSFLIATLTSAIQELNAKVNALETQLSAK